jgi:outer membrane usher protein
MMAASLPLRARRILALSALVVAFGAAGPARAGDLHPEIEDIVSVQDATGTTVRFKFATPPASMPTVFSLDSPPRLVVDFVGVGQEERSTFPFDANMITSATLVGGKSRTRVVLALREPSRGEIKLDGTDLVLTLIAPGAEPVKLSFPESVKAEMAVQAEPERKLDTATVPPVVAKVAPQSKTQETLLLEMIVNDQPVSGIFRAERLADGKLALALDAWRLAGLREVGEPLLLPDGERAYALESVDKLEYRVDRARLILALVVPPSGFDAASYSLTGKQQAQPDRPSTGAYLNYSVSATRQQPGGNSFGGTVEAVVFTGAGSLVSGVAVRHGPRGTEAVRTDTSWRKDWPAEMKTLVLGDTVGSDGGWSRPARFGGVRYGRDFALAPGFITYPLPSISGASALPSTVDILVNNQRQSGTEVKAGAFDLTNIPVVSGAGEINLVVRDLRGVETVLTQGYYMSPLLLAPGLSDFSAEAGALRRNYGISRVGDYGPGFAAGSYRYGVTSGLTVSGRAELQRTRQAAGVEATALLDTIAVARGAAAWSRSDEGGDSRNGVRWLAALERVSHWGGGAVQLEHFSEDFVQFGAGAKELRPRDRLQANVGVSLGGGKSAGLSYIRQTAWNGERFTLAAANLGIALPGNMHLSAYVAQQMDGSSAVSGGLNLIVPTANQVTTVVSSNRDRKGDVINSAQVAKVAPAGEGWGWIARASDVPSQRAQGGATYNSDHGRVSADVSLGSDSNALRVGADGSVGWFEGLPFATRRIDHGAFAVVKVGDVAGVPIMRSNQVVAVTNKSGMALVPGLLPYQSNFLSVDPDQLPLEVTIGSVQRVTVPYARSGVLLEFPIRRARNVLATLVQQDGAPVPPGARVTVLPGNQEFTVVKRGGVYMTDVQGAESIAVSWNGGACTVGLGLTQSAGVEVEIGPLVCGSGGNRPE